MNYIKDVKLYNKDEINSVNMIIEIEKKSKDKNELVEPTFEKVERVRKCKLKYPFYYGCFPQTLAGDNDPADAILITKEKHKVLDVVKVQPIAIIKTVDNGEEDNKVICIEGEIKNLDKELKRVLHFLCVYKGKKADTQVDKTIYNDAEAIANIKESAQRHIKVKGSKINSLKVD